MSSCGVGGGWCAGLGQGGAIKRSADGSTGLLGDLLHGTRIGDAVEEQRVYALLSDLLGKTSQLSRGRLAVVGPAIDREHRNTVGPGKILQRIVRGEDAPLGRRYLSDLC